MGIHYNPDPGIVRQLRQADPDLDARWNGDKQRWEVTCRGKTVSTIQGPDGSFLPLDGRAVTDMRRRVHEYRQHYGAFRRVDLAEREDNDREAKKRTAKRRDDFRQYAIEEIHPRVVGVGGANGRNKFAGWSK